MSAKELRSKSKADLQDELLKEREALFNLRMQKGTGQLARPDLMKKTRRRIAVIKTVMQQQTKGDQ